MPHLGCISDDFTGGTDLANNLVRSGFRTVQCFGTPTNLPDPGSIDAIVIALKTRTCPVETAVSESTAAIRWLDAIGCRQFYFKYCSTFDSTPRGNIGPVIDALLETLGIRFTIACPAFPDNGRTLYRGHLFVYDQLLNESGMRYHPLTPMTDSNILRVLRPQTTSEIDLVSLEVVREGEKAVRAQFEKHSLQFSRRSISVTDAVSNADLRVLAAASSSLKLVTGGSGLALGLGENFGLAPGRAARRIPARGGRAILAGSCSQMTLKQIAAARQIFPALRVEPASLEAEFDRILEETSSWASKNLSIPETIVIYTSGTPEEIEFNQKRMGKQRAGELCERFLAELAARIVGIGVSQLIVAGGETSGAVVSRLGLDRLYFGPEIAPGVPWTLASGQGETIALALKSGNFGSERFFIDAWTLLDSGS